MATIVVSVPDPATAGTYSTDAESRTFMGDALVEFAFDSVMSLTQIGDTAGLFDGGDWIEIATAGSPDDAFIGIQFIFAGPDATVVIFTTRSDSADTTYSNFWVVGSDGSNSVTRIVPPTEDNAVNFTVIPDQRLETTDLRIYLDDGVPEADPTAQISVPGATVLVDDVFPPDDANINASTWAAFIAGDVTTDATQPDGGVPFDSTITIGGHHATGNDNYLYFTFWLDPTDNTMGNWDGAQISFEMSDYSGTIPDVFLAVDGFSDTIIQINDAPTITTDGVGGPAISAINTAYFVQPGSPPGVQPGQVFLTYSSISFPDVGADFFSKMAVTVTKTETITPTPGNRYKQGQYRYLNAVHDDTSSYDDPDLPGTEYMASDFFDTPAGRWTLVVAMLQDADNFGGNNQGSFAVHFESFGAIIAAAFAPPLRRYPRDDGLATSSARRLYPPNRSIQRSNRQAGGYL